MIIYKARNIINDKIYIGKTKFKLEERRNQHFQLANLNADYVFSKALRKYKAEGFHWEILERDIHSEEILNSLEKKHIKEFNSLIPSGYNMTEGGTGGTMAPEVLERMSQIRMGRTKENNPAMKAMADKLRGRTKYTDPSLMVRSEKRKGRTKENDPQYKLISERKTGRTKENDPSMKAMAEKLTGRTKETHLYLKQHSERMKGIMKLRWFKRKNPDLFSFDNIIPPILPIEYQVTNEDTLNIIN